MKKHAIAVIVIVAIGAGITLSKAHAFTKSQQQSQFSKTLHDGDPKPLCPPPPFSCQ